MHAMVSETVWFLCGVVVGIALGEGHRRHHDRPMPGRGAQLVMDVTEEKQSMSTLPQKLRPGAKLHFNWSVRKPNGDPDPNAVIGNVDLELTDVKNAGGTPVPTSTFASITRIDGQHDDADVSADSGSVGYTGTFTATATVTWDNDGSPVQRTLTATGTGTISEDEGAGDILVMEVTIDSADAGTPVTDAGTTGEGSTTTVGTGTTGDGGTAGAGSDPALDTPPADQGGATASEGSATAGSGDGSATTGGGTEGGEGDLE